MHLMAIVSFVAGSWGAGKFLEWCAEENIILGGNNEFLRATSNSVKMNKFYSCI